MKHFIGIFFAFVFLLISTINSSLAQTNWTKDPNNPVLSGGGSGTWNRHVLGPSVLYNPDSSRYEMWYFASSGPPNWLPYHIGYAISEDGMTWTRWDTAVLLPDPGTWDGLSVESPLVLQENGTYKMWYTGRSLTGLAIGYATSTDGISWTKYLSNPVMGAGVAGWEDRGVAWCTVTMNLGGGYRMWYTDISQQGDTTGVGYATSVDGITWQRHSNNPVLTPGSSGEWDEGIVVPTQVLFISGTYYMWYSGYDNSGQSAIGLATSLDGITWAKYNDPSTPNPPFSESDPVLIPSSGQWDGSYVENGHLILVGGMLHMWYNGSREPIETNLLRIGHATSIITRIENNIFSDIPAGFTLHQNYPNPFNPTTSIEFSLPQSGFVTLKVYNILGEEVATLGFEKLTAGRYKYDWNASSLASGVYLYRIQAGNYVESKKMILLK